MNSIARTRIKKELEMFENSPPPGISCLCDDDDGGDKLNKFSAQILGATDTPFEGGVFTLDIQIPDRYPFEPPSIRFVTPIYHPNVDTLGRICLDTLKPPPQGSWKPHLNISAVLMMIRVLMAEPGEEDPLMTDIWQEFKYDYVTYVRKAKEWTKKHAGGQESLDLKVQVASKTPTSASNKNVDPSRELENKHRDVVWKKALPGPRSDPNPEPLEKRFCLGENALGLSDDS